MVDPGCAAGCSACGAEVLPYFSGPPQPRRTVRHFYMEFLWYTWQDGIENLGLSKAILPKDHLEFFKKWNLRLSKDDRYIFIDGEDSIPRYNFDSRFSGPYPDCPTPETAEGYLHLLLKVYDHGAKVWMNYDPKFLDSPPGSGRLSVDIKRAAYFLPIGRTPLGSTSSQGSGEHYVYVVCMSLPETPHHEPEIRLLISGRKRKGKEIPATTPPMKPNRNSKLGQSSSPLPSHTESESDEEDDSLYFYRLSLDVRRIHMFRNGDYKSAGEVFKDFKPTFSAFIKALVVLRDEVNTIFKSNYEEACADAKKLAWGPSVNMAEEMTEEMAEDMADEMAEEMADELADGMDDEDLYGA